MIRRLLWVLLLASCARGVRPSASESLSGLTFELPSGGEPRLAVVGEVQGRAAEVRLEISSMLTTVSRGCFSSPPRSPGKVKVPLPSGSWQELDEVQLDEAKVGPASLGSRMAALVDGDSCVLTLGADLLEPYALRVDLERRELTISPSQARQKYSASAGEELYVLELTFEPRTDWPLVTVRARQGTAELTGPFVLSTTEPFSKVGQAAALAAGLQEGLEPLGADALPKDTHHEVKLEGFGLEQFELAPGVGLSRLFLSTDPSWKSHGVLGVLGANAWGHFRATFDLRAGVLVLQRPRVVGEGAHQRCAREGQSSEEACFSLFSRREEQALVVAVTVWRELSEGGRLYLEPRGQAAASACRLGVSFGPSDRGASKVFRLPWSGLLDRTPECAEAYAKATGVGFALFEEASLPRCPGRCAFASDLAGGNTSCDCDLEAGASSLLERQFLQHFWRLMDQRKAAPSGPTENEPEPD